MSLITLLLLKINNFFYNANFEGGSLKVLFSLAFKNTFSEGARKAFPLFHGPESLDELPIDCGALNVELALREVLELGVLLHGLDHISASPEEYTHDVERGLLAVNSENAEGVLAQLVIHALEETIEEVVGHMQDDTLTLVLLIVDEIEREGSVIPTLPECLQGLFLVVGINNQSLDIIEVKAIWDSWQEILPSLLFRCCHL